jgi:DNA modification methylase
MERVEIGRAVLYHGDCREILPSLKFDAMVTDPPYEIIDRHGVAKSKNGTRRMQFHFDVPGVFDECVIPALASALENASGNCGHFVFSSPEHISKVYALFREFSYRPKPAVWVKSCPPPPMSGNWWVSAHETAVYAIAPGAWFGDQSAKRPNVFEFDSYRHGVPGKVNHPTQKPLALMEKIITALAPPDAVVLDPFSGSASTGVACVMHGRQFIGIEKEKAYFDIACMRIERAQQQADLFVA